MTRRAQILRLISIAILAFFALYRLGDYPTTWFDEGSHLHVPKALLSRGVYADYSSDGLRYFGPTIGVGPTVMLPIAAMFKIFGIGLVQARLVIVAYLFGALYFFYRLARNISGPRVAALAVTLLVSSRAIALLETGRQVLGEVPALFFLLSAFLVWFGAWDGRQRRLIGAGLLFGAAAITKYQILLAIAPAFAVAFCLNYLYYRQTLARVFVVPASVTAGVFILWQAILVVYLGPQNSLQNFAALRAATAGAATVFSFPLMRRAASELVAFKTFDGALAIALAYGVFLASQRSRKGQQWNTLLLFVVMTLGWYVFASVSWLRYAFAGLAIASLFLAQFFADLFEILLSSAPRPDDFQFPEDDRIRAGLIAMVGIWAALIIVPSMTAAALPVLRPPMNAASAMANYLAREVPTSEVIETWEPELGFLTAHNYHYPPTGTLNIAVRHIWSGGPAPRQQYRPLENDRPPYVVVGAFGRWVGLYPSEVLDRDYRRVTTIGDYELYARKVTLSAERSAP